MSGSVEVAPCLNIADIVCDLVVTGNSMLKNNLNPVIEILESKAVLIGNVSIDPLLSVLKSK